jgi:hypothetical protein
MRVQKMREQRSRRREMSTPVPVTSDDDMVLLDNDESPLIKGRYPPPTGMGINMVFTLLTLKVLSPLHEHVRMYPK